MEFLRSDFCIYDKREINGVPVIIVTPKCENKNIRTIVFYHGWGSDNVNQVFRANIFASYGYRVVLPCARFHGKRGELDYENEEVARKYMLETIMHNIEEAPAIFKFIKEEFGSNEIAIAGHSMGAITAGGLYCFKKDLKMAFIYNGMNDWGFLVDEINNKKDIKNTPYEELRINDFFIDMNPLENCESFKDRPMVLFNGEDDNVVNPKAQENFYNRAVKIYTNKELINFEKFEQTSHQLTTQMIDMSIQFSKEVAKF